MKFLNVDSPVMRFLGRMADLMILNLITTFFCIPIITAGAAFTALHYESLKLVRGEECYIMKEFWHSFKTNFKQATIIWVMMLAFILLFISDYNIVTHTEGMERFATPLIVVGIVVAWLAQYILPVLSHFENTVIKTIKNGVFMSLMAAPKSLAMLIFAVLPVYGLFASVRIIPFVLLFGFSLPAYLGAIMYNGTFKKFEPEDEGIVSDEEFHVVVEDEDSNVEENQAEK